MRITPEARRAAKATTTEKAPAAAPSIEIAKPSLEAAPTAATSAAASPQWSRKVHEIQQIAEKAGFIGVSEQDIRQAYMQGSSLLADYRV
jgi:hypothetical protein